MANRNGARLLLLAVFFLGVAVEAFATSVPPTLPTRRADIVLPLLRKFNSGDNLTWIDQVLGKPDIDMGRDVYVNYYLLSDHTAIVVGVNIQTDRVLYIRRAHGKTADELIYAVDPAWAQKSR